MDELESPEQVPVPSEGNAQTPEQPQDAPAKKKRHRRTNAEIAAARAEALESFDASVEGPVAAPRTSSRRSSKLKGDDVASGIELASTLAVMMTKQQHWYIPKSEVAPWANQAAELLNRIPAKYVRSVTDMNGFIIVGAGIYGTMKPRLDYSEQLRRERLAARQKEQAAGAVSEAEKIVAADQVPWAL